MASVLRQLSDSDLEVIHHMIRRDSLTDSAIADAAGERLGKPISASAAGRVNIIHRYRKSKTFQTWLKRYRAERSGMERALLEQSNRFDMLRDVLRDQDGTGIENVSKALQARALTLAAEAPAEEFLDGLSGKGWVANVLKLAQATSRDVNRQRIDELKKQLAAMAVKGESGAAAGVDMQQVVNKVDDIMGL